MKLHTYTGISLAVLAGIALSTPAFAVVTVDYVPSGNAGNAADTLAGNYGAVAYEYKIAKNETTIADYAQFLNAVAATDTYSLYNSNMGSNANIAGITRTNSSGSYSYSVTGSGARPITYVSWFDAARYTNWMHNGQGSGSTETGAYTLVGGQTSGNAPAKNVGASVWLPSENEWYKAAYYDPRKNSEAGGYWLHANQSDTMTSNSFATPGAANFFDGDYVGSFPSGNVLTDVGAYGTDSQSFYGTNDQAGNVFEWNDLNAELGSSRGLRGGAWGGSDSSDLAASFRFVSSPTNESTTVGFRLASVPEPSAYLLTVLSASVLLTRRRRSTL